MSEHPYERAAESLAALLRGWAWYLTIGVDPVGIVVYAKITPPSALVPTRWQGVPVRVAVTGPIVVGPAEGGGDG